MLKNNLIRRVTQTRSILKFHYNIKRPLSYALYKYNLKNIKDVKILSNTFNKQLVRTMFIQTETTPNPDSIKFIPGCKVMGDSPSIEFINAREAMISPLAKKLYLIDGISTLFFGPDFVSVTKDSSANWPNLKPEIFATLMDFFASGQPIIFEGEQEMPSDTRIEEGDSETVQMIKELIETRIRPSIQEDGGDIEYLGFDNGIVKLKLRGACRTCESSEVTLKHGIQNMLMHYIPEVEAVEQVQDELEQLSQTVFEGMEEQIRVRKN